MPKKPRYVLIFAPETIDQMDVIELKYHRLIRNTIDEQLSYTPKEINRNRKPLEQPAPFGAT
ncbi:MAG: hypothetical protein HY717_05715 [Planctomycetes bacterium]|nr:hypothetical protein [Planctomycetota bacterium]